MKHLKVEYTTDTGKKVTLFDADVTEVSWTDTAAGVRVEGKTAPAAGAAGNPGISLLEALAGAARNRNGGTVETVAEPKPKRKIKAIDRPEDDVQAD